MISYQSLLLSTIVLNDMYACYFTVYTDDLIKKVLELSMNEDDKPTLPTPPSPLASKYEHPDKESIPLFSRYKH